MIVYSLALEFHISLVNNYKIFSVSEGKYFRKLSNARQML
jgi:hypothetical protein